MMLATSEHSLTFALANRILLSTKNKLNKEGALLQTLNPLRLLRSIPYVVRVEKASAHIMKK